MLLSALFGRRSRPTPVRRARLSLEALDGRFCPDGNDATNPSGTLYLVTTPPDVNAPPEIINFTAVEISSGVVNISGTVVDEDPAGLTVTFQGPQTAINGKTVTTASSGTFSLTVTLAIDGSDDGMVSAQTVDRAGLASNVVYVDVQPR
jgi:hypothetical protein